MDIALIVGAFVMGYRGWPQARVALVWGAAAGAAFLLDIYRFGLGMSDLWISAWAIAWLLVVPLATLVAFSIGAVIRSRRAAS